jgi:hypothetical protein
MELNEILEQPEGFTPPAVTVKIKKVWDYKSGEGDNGPWSFQSVETENGGRLKLKGLPQFPKAREGQTVTLRANQSKQHGLTGMKVNHEEYQGKTYHQLVITNSCKWEFAAGSQNGNGSAQSSASAPQGPPMGIEGYIEHLISVAALTNQITTILLVDDPAAVQACFATLCIDTKNRGIVLPKTLPVIAELRSKEQAGDPDDDNQSPPPDFTDEDIPF